MTMLRLKDFGIWIADFGLSKDKFVLNTFIPLRVSSWPSWFRVVELKLTSDLEFR